MTAIVTQLIDYENGELEPDEVLALFAELVKSGLAWQLQGSYGRAAAELIGAGYLSPEGEILEQDL